MKVTGALQPDSSSVSTRAALRYIPAIALCASMAVLRIRLLLQPLPPQDFMTYWAAARLFLSHANPYSTASIYAIERTLGWNYRESLVLLNPPWSFPLIVLLSVLPFTLARVAWLVASLLIESVCGLALWSWFGGSRRMRWLALVLVATFMPLGSAEHMGQITPLMLAGLTGFLWAAERRRDLLAGTCLLALGLKPHLLLLVLLAIILWTIQQRRWKIAIAACGSTAIATAAAVLYNLNTLTYFHNSAAAALGTQCGIGGTLRYVFGVEHAWLQFLPTIAGVVWFPFYWMQHRGHWIWQQRLPVLLLASLAAAPYCWSHDYILAFPAILAAAVALSRTATDWMLPAAAYVATQVLISDASAALDKAWSPTVSLVWAALYFALLTAFFRGSAPAPEMELSAQAL